MLNTLNERKMKTEVLLKNHSLVTIEDLKRTDHVGFIHNHSLEKGYVSTVSINGKIQLIAMAATGKKGTMVDVYSEPIQHTIQEVLTKSVGDLGKVYVFDTRKELYQWLAE